MYNYFYVPSVAGSGKCIYLSSAWVMKREMYISMYRVWQEQGKVCISLSTACDRIRELYAYLCLLPVTRSGNYVYLCLLPVTGSGNCMYISVYCL